MYVACVHVIHTELDINLGQLLAFITGADKIPAMGFHNPISVFFEHEAPMKYPNVSTCAPSITFPAGMDDYEILERDFVQAVKLGSLCFGRV